MKIVITGLFILATVLLGSCVTPEKALPPGNVKAINGAANDIAPIQRPAESSVCRACSRMPFPVDLNPRDAVVPSSYYFNELFADVLKDKNNNHIPFLTNGHQAMTFVDATSGFVSFSHPPSESYAKMMNLPIRGIVGGADIFEFHLEKGRYVFNNLGETINSEFWDSHPFVIRDTSCNKLIIWSSDRARPFAYQATADSGNTRSFNTDLYYSFYTEGKWSPAKSMSEISGEINNESNEMSPFLSCLCHNPTLLFSSDRDGSFDIFSMKLSVDFQKQTIKAESGIVKLPEGEINTKANEMFPCIPFLGSNSDIIYFASDRYPTEFELNSDTVIISKGGYDIYSFPYDGQCRAPFIDYNVVLLDSETGLPVTLKPFIITEYTDAGGKRVRSRTSQNSNELKHIKMYQNYRVYGGSDYDNIVCSNDNESNCVISRYERPVIEKLDYLIRQDTSYYDSTRGGRVVVDTIPRKIIIPISELSTVSADEFTIIKSLDVRGDSVIVKTLHLEKRKVGGRKIRKRRIVAVTDSTPRWDTTWVKSADSPELSEFSKQGFALKYFAEQDTTIFDTIYVKPDYYCFPPCEWLYIDSVINFRKNVPYFQTGYWEVNLPRNFLSTMRKLSSRKFSNATQIELHPKHRIFGTEMARRAKRYNEYRDFANIVQKNLKRMSNEITQNIIPEFTRLASVAPQNKLFIQLHGLSDIRPITKGKYLGKRVRYMAGSYSASEAETPQELPRLVSIDIPDYTSLVGEDNKILSDLRAYYGYKELIRNMMKDTLLKAYADRGEVIFPDSISSQAEFEEKMDKAKIVFLIEGKRVDSSAIISIYGYKGIRGDFYSLDWIRRINVLIHRVEYKSGAIFKTSCCAPAAAFIEDEVQETKQIKVESQPVKQKKFKKFVPKNLQEDTSENPLGDLEVPMIKMQTYTISFGSYEKKNDAQSILKLFKKHYIEDLRIVRNIIPAGNTVYSVRSGHYINKNTAEKSRVKYDEILAADGWDVQTMVLKEK